MLVIQYNSKIKLPPSVLILGAFDGLHNGHLHLIKIAQKQRLPITITLFDNINLIPSKMSNWQYSSFNVKLQQLSKLGINNVIVIPFRKIQNLQGEKFIQLMTNLSNAQQIIVGHNFAYGQNRQNNVHNLKQQFHDVIIVPEYKIHNKKVSTSFLKELVVLGEVDLIHDFAPFPYTREAQITNIKRRSHLIALKVSPIYQVIWNHEEKLHYGVYAVFVVIEQIRYYGLLYHMFETSIIYVPDFTTKYANHPLQIMVISQIRILTHSQQIPISLSKFNQDLLNSKNKLITYLKNNI